MPFSFFSRACNSLFTALEKSQEAIEITSEDHVIQVCSSHKYRKLLCILFRLWLHLLFLTAQGSNLMHLKDWSKFSCRVEFSPFKVSGINQINFKGDCCFWMNKDLLSCFYFLYWFFVSIIHSFSIARMNADTGLCAFFSKNILC